MAEQLNPLAFIGASNDPTLIDRAKNEQRGLIDLENKLGLLAEKGRNERANTQLSGGLAQALAQNNMYRAANINPLLPSAGGFLNDRRESDLANTDAEAFRRRAEGSLSGGKLGLRPLPIPEGGPPVPLGNRVGPKALTIDGPPLGDSAAAAGTPKLQSDASVEQDIEKVEFINGALVKINEKRKSSQQGSTKGAPTTPRQQLLTNKMIDAIHASATKALTAAVATGNRVPFKTIEVLGYSKTRGIVVLSIDGGPPETFPTPKKK